MHETLDARYYKHKYKANLPILHMHETLGVSEPCCGHWSVVQLWSLECSCGHLHSNLKCSSAQHPALHGECVVLHCIKITLQSQYIAVHCFTPQCLGVGVFTTGAIRGGSAPPLLWTPTHLKVFSFQDQHCMYVTMYTIHTYESLIQHLKHEDA